MNITSIDLAECRIISDNHNTYIECPYCRVMHIVIDHEYIYCNQSCQQIFIREGEYK